MLRIQTENIGNLAILECEGRIVNSESAFRLRNAVTSQTDASVTVLDLTEVHALDGGGLGMLVFLQRWAHDHHVDSNCSTHLPRFGTGWKTPARYMNLRSRACMK